MANVYRPSGLSPVKSIVGDAFSGQGSIYQIAAANASGYAIGDPVISSGTGSAAGVSGVVLGAATGALRGVIVGLGTDPTTLLNPLNLNSIVRPAAAQATDWFALVMDDPNTIFTVYEKNTGTPLAAVDIGMNANLVVGTNNGYISGWYLDNAATATTSTVQVRLLGLSQVSGNAFGNGAQWLVKINNHELSAGTAGVA